ncbi:hypothetical protein Q3G72_020986 [Acer saccharum]|nr:hypothetical protein Q3G72_020986 [Acer saccharum]
MVAEAVTLLRGIELAMDSGLLPAIVESDAMGVVKLVNYGCRNSADIYWPERVLTEGLSGQEGIVMESLCMHRGPSRTYEA